MTRILMMLALVALLGACAAPATQPGAGSKAADTATADDKRCMRVTQTGSNMAQRRCARSDG